jgi:type I restriction enzyme R subunit
MRQLRVYVLQVHKAHGVEEPSLRRIRDFLRIRHGGPNDGKAALGSEAEIRKAFIDIQGHFFRRRTPKG